MYYHLHILVPVEMPQCCTTPLPRLKAVVDTSNVSCPPPQTNQQFTDFMDQEEDGMLHAAAGYCKISKAPV